MTPALIIQKVRMRKAKTIDDLYSEVKDADVVLCNDAPLATALNNRLDIPRIGIFAVTARHLAAKEAVNILGETPWNDLKIISHISAETGYDMKFVHGEIENIRSIRKYTRSVERYLHSRTSKKIYKIFTELPTIEKVMDSYDPEKTEIFVGKKVAVIGLDLFDDLDKHFVPLRFIDIDMFERGSFDIDTIYEAGNDRQIADNAVDIITAENATDVAVVMDTAGTIADSVRSALYRKGIPFKNTLTVKDLAQIRDYLEFVRSSLSFDTLRIRQIRELFSAYGATISQNYDEYLLSMNMEYMNETSASRRLAEVMKNIRERTFKEVCDEIVNIDRHRPQIYMLLDDLEMTDVLVDEQTVNSITYAVNNISDLRHNEEIPEEEKQGVLLADCNNSVYIDRPVVIFLGIGQEWFRTQIGKEYMDRETETDLCTDRFQILLQQGSERIYMVNSMKNGRKARPCTLFDNILLRPAKTFEDVCARLLNGDWYVHTNDEKEEHVPSQQKGIPKKFSKSTLNSYLTCPRQYMFSELIPMPEKEFTVFGNAVHEFAEFCTCYPEMVDRNGIEMYAEMISNRFASLSCPELKDIDRSRIDVSLKNIRTFISSLGRFEPDRIKEDKRNRNMFLDHHSLKKISSAVEAMKESGLTPLRGTFDLLYDSTIVDYKTGSPGTLDDIKKRMDESDDDVFIETQPLVYLTILDDIGVGRKRFRTFYVLDNPERSLREPMFNIAENMRDVILLNVTREEFIRTDLKELVANKFPFVNDIWPMFAESFISSGVNDTSGWMDAENEISAKVPKRTNVSGAIKEAVRIMKGKAISSDNELIITKDMLAGFREMVKRKHEEMNACRNAVFPAFISKRCGRCSYFSVCTAAKGDTVD